MNKTNSLCILSICLMLFILAACSPVSNKRGNLLEDFQTSEVVPNIHTQSDVLRILGSPTTKSPFDDNIWYYIGQETEKRGILDPEVTEEKIVAVTFNEEGIVQSLNKMNSNRIDIPLERTKTPTHGNQVTIMQQFLGNLGKFNPQDQGQ